MGDCKVQVAILKARKTTELKIIIKSVWEGINKETDVKLAVCFKKECLMY